MASTPPTSEPIGTSPADRETRAGRILNEFLDRRVRGETASEAELLAAHPDLADELRECLELVGDLRPAAERIDTLIAQGTLTKSDDPRYLAELGAYKITGCIGRGGMGVVLKAYEESLNRTVALKILRPDLADDGNALARFEREAKAAAALNHPNIVTVYAVGQERGVHYIAMEYVDGPSLAEVIGAQPSAIGRQPSAGAALGGTVSAVPDAGRDTADTAVPRAVPDVGKDTADTAVPRAIGTDTIRVIFRQLLSALGAAHEAGLIHRDVKSSNILLDRWCGQGTGTGEQGTGPDGIPPQSSIDNRQSSLAEPQAVNPEPSVKLADFGLARMVTATTRVTLGDSILGTPEYMSPEQARGDTDIDHRTDLYSAGVVLYEMLTGRTPFRADAPTATIRRILDEEPVDPQSIDKNVDPVLASLALRLVAKQPEDRLASASDALTALDANKRVSSLPCRRRFRKRFAAALAGLAVISAAIWLSPRSEEWAGDSDLAAVWTDPRRPTVIYAQYGSDGPTTVFHEFPAAVVSVADVALVHRGEEAAVVVVAGVAQAVNGACLFAFDANGTELRSMDLTDQREWPDCGPPGKWKCTCLAVADLDGIPGDELVVAAGHVGEYSARMSIIDSRTWEIRSTFWHMGGFAGLEILPHYFEGERPAILAWGVNNKLDGFGDPVPADYEGPRYTKYAIVSVVMILDPRQMDGLGPPRTDRIEGLRPARPYAYAFLDLSFDESIYFSHDLDEFTGPAPAELAYIAGFHLAAEYLPDDSGPWLKVGVARRSPAFPNGGGELIVDRDLKPHLFKRNGGERIGTTLDWWATRWRVIIQGGRYVEE